MRLLTTALLSCALVGATFAQAQNDDCSTAAVISGLGTWAFDTTNNTTSGFSGAGGCASAVTAEQDTFWQWTATAPGTYIIDTCGSSFDTVTAANLGVGCAAVCEAFDDLACGVNSSVFVTNVNVGDAYLIQVGGWAVGEAGSGLLNIAFDPCSLLPDDQFEDNDDCNQTTTLGDGFYPDLFVAKSDMDFYELTVAAGSTLTVTLDHINANGDSDIYLYDSFGGCMGPSAGNPGCTGTLACSSTVADQETFMYSNPSNNTETYILKVSVWASTTTGDCNDYDLTIMGTTGTGGGGVGTSYCTANPNSTGNAGVISATGSALAAGNNVTLTADQLPLNAFGFFLTSQSQGLVMNPGGSQGNLCLGGSIGRYVGPGQIKNSGAAGSIELLLDLTQTPTPMGLVQVNAGETWNFTTWHRDSSPGGATSNFTDGVSILFQ